MKESKDYAWENSEKVKAIKSEDEQIWNEYEKIKNATGQVLSVGEIMDRLNITYEEQFRDIYHSTPVE